VPIVGRPSSGFCGVRGAVVSPASYAKLESYADCIQQDPFVTNVPSGTVLCFAIHSQKFMSSTLSNPRPMTSSSMNPMIVVQTKSEAVQSLNASHSCPRRPPVNAQTIRRYSRMRSTSALRPISSAARLTIPNGCESTR